MNLCPQLQHSYNCELTPTATAQRHTCPQCEPMHTVTAQLECKFILDFASRIACTHTHTRTHCYPYSQLQYSLLDRRPENGMTDYCQKNNIKYVCGSGINRDQLKGGIIGPIPPQEPFCTLDFSVCDVFRRMEIHVFVCLVMPDLPETEQFRAQRLHYTWQWCVSRRCRHLCLCVW